MIDEKKHAAFMGLRHTSPEVIRNIRAAIDVGVTSQQLRKSIKKTVHSDFVKHALLALEYMIETPTAGVVKWDGMRYDWIDRGTVAER